MMKIKWKNKRLVIYTVGILKNGLWYKDEN